MTNSRTTKKALLSSALALLMCVAMLIATTFAWFTDTASTSVNKIQAGKLDVALEMKNTEGNWVNAEGETLQFKKAAAGATQEVLWEPGCTYELPAIRVVNKGNLAFKYKLVVSGAIGDTKLLDVINFTVKDSSGTETSLTDMEGIILPEGTEATEGTDEKVQYSDVGGITIKGHMEENAGNEYQDLSVSGIAITVYAQQYTYEYDSYNKTYDGQAESVITSSPFSNYVNVTATTATNGSAVLTDSNDSAKATITATIPSGSTTASSLTLIKEPTANPDSVTIATGESAISTDVKIIDTNTKQTISAQGDTYFTIDIQLGQVDLQRFYHRGTALEKVENKDSLDAAGQYFYDSVSGVVTFTTNSFSSFTAVFKFAGGNGTEKYPYLIVTKEHFQGLNDEYNAGKFNYYKIANSVTTLDLNDVGQVRLFGVFDGNNKTVEVNNSLFYCTYSDDDEGLQPTIKNLTVKENQSAGALVWTVGSSVVNFENVNVSGVIERNNHGAAFVVYGTCNFDDKGKDYTLNFKNCSCDAKIITRSEGNVAILVGHAYQGKEKTLTINMDSETNTGIQDAKLYGAAPAAGYKYYAVSFGKSVDVYVDNSKVADAHATFAATTLEKAAPVRANDGTYTLTSVENAASVKVQVLSQLTAYDDDSTVIASLRGITNTNGTCYSEAVESNATVKVFEKVTSVVLKKGKTTSGSPEYTLDADGKLTIKTNDTANYITGTIRIAAYQYDDAGVLISSGVLDIANTTGTPAEGNVTWTINK